ncbi:MAG: hypothetical protein WC699_17205 [Bacteroidales bacterium]
MSKDCEVVAKPKTFRELMGSAYFWTPARAIIIGGILGYLYYHFIGCASGSCAITSNPYLSIISGGFLGLAFINRPCRSC